MKFTKLAIIITSAILFTACSPGSIPKPEMSSESKEIDVPQLNKESGSNDDLKKKFDFNKDITLVSIKETNNASLTERPLGGITSQSAHILNDKLELFYDSELPTEKTSLIVLESKFDDFDYMIDHNVYLSESNYSFKLKDVRNDYIDNNNRLFNNERIKVDNKEEGLIEIIFDDEVFPLKAGESKIINKSKDDVVSEIEFQNYGLMNSIKDMTYEELDED